MPCSAHPREGCRRAWRSTRQMAALQAPEAVARTFPVSPKIAPPRAACGGPRQWLPEPASTPLRSNSNPAPMRSMSSNGAEDRSVVGIPFPISDSVLSTCKRYSEVVECERRVLVPLRRFGLEPRDGEWASTTEAALKNQKALRTHGISHRREHGFASPMRGASAEMSRRLAG